jgi:hypothetical protein
MIILKSNDYAIPSVVPVRLKSHERDSRSKIIRNQ